MIVAREMFVGLILSYLGLSLSTVSVRCDSGIPIHERNVLRVEGTSERITGPRYLRPARTGRERKRTKESLDDERPPRTLAIDSNPRPLKVRRASYITKKSLRNRFLGMLSIATRDFPNSIDTVFDLHAREY